jgi:hypothetical protein
MGWGRRFLGRANETTENRAKRLVCRQRDGCRKERYLDSRRRPAKLRGITGIGRRGKGTLLGIQMKVFAEQTSEGPSVFNIQLATWKIAIERWRGLEERFRDDECDFNKFFEEACVILVLAGTSASQLLGQNTSSTSSHVPSVENLVDELVPDRELCLTMKEFNSTYEDLRHFGEPKHSSVIKIDGAHFTRWMLAVQKLWIDLGRPHESIKKSLFRNTFEVEWIEEDS